jgi:transcriptional regulator with XRE-family HTH domain
MEKTFLRMKARPSARHAYLEAEVVTGLAHQIRAIRMQRGWTQNDLAKRLHTTQAAVSRLEDPSYGRYTLSTLVELAKTFDSGMQVRFVSFVTMLHETFVPNAKNREVPTFEEEASHVDFYRTATSLSGVVYLPAQPQPQLVEMAYLNIPLGQTAPKSFAINIPLPNSERIAP